MSLTQALNVRFHERIHVNLKEDAMMPLTLASVGAENMIQRVGGNPAVKKHLEDMGFVAGGSVTVVSANGGNLIVSIQE